MLKRGVTEKSVIIKITRRHYLTMNMSCTVYNSNKCIRIIDSNVLILHVLHASCHGRNKVIHL